MFKRVIADLPKYFFLLLVTAAILVPIYYMVMTSVKSHDEYLENKLNPPKRVTLENFKEIFFEQKFLRLMYNSLRVTLISGIICVVVSTLAAFAFSNYDFPLKNLLFVGILSLMSVPPIVMVIPLFMNPATLVMTSYVHTTRATESGSLQEFAYEIWLSR